MKRLLFALVGIVVLLVIAVFVGPRVVDLRPRIAAAVHDATGRDLRIDGNLHVALFPTLSISAGDVHLSNAPGAATPEMLSAVSVALKVELWPLLRRQLVIDSLVIDRPTINLEVGKDGRPNWVFQTPGKPEAAPPNEKPTAQGGWLAGVQLGNVKIEQGRLSYRNDLTGQTINAKEITLAATMTELESPLNLQARMTLNNEPVKAELSVDTLGTLQRGNQAKVKLLLDTHYATAKFDGTAQQRPVPGLNGTFDLDIPSVGKLATWLQQPLPSGQPDPGPLQMHAVFATDGAKSVLKDATIVGTALNVNASGSFEASGGVTKITGVVDSGVLDIDRYLPRQTLTKSAPKAPPKSVAGPMLTVRDPFARLSDRPFDLAALRKLDADVKVSIGGIKAMGYDVGRIAFTAMAKRGALTADLGQIALYGGRVTGIVKLDGAGDVLGLDASAKIDHVTVDKLAEQVAAGTPVTGTISATLDAKARGKSPRALAEDLRGHLAVDLGSVAMKNMGTHAMSQLKLDLDLPGGDKATSLAAGLVYNGERVDTNASLGPLRKIAAGERFPAKLAVNSRFVTLRYDGTVQQKPVPGLDGAFDLDIPSVAKLAAWVGKPLGAKQPDPGPLKLHAVLASDGTKLALKDAAIVGKAINATAKASFDASQKPATFDATIDVQQADLNAYLPPPAEKPATAKPATQQRQNAGWSTAPFDLTPLGSANGKAAVTVAAVRYHDIEINKGAINLALTNRVLKIDATKLALAQGTVDTAVTLDASTSIPKIDCQVAVAGVQALPLLKTFAGSDRLGGTVAFETTIKGHGKNEKELISSLNGAGRFKITDGAIYGINLAQILRKAGTLGFGSSTTEKTDFAELSGSYAIKSGIIENRDMKMLAPLLRLTGGGTVPMLPQTVDYALEAKLVPTLQGQGGQDSLAGLPIPIKVTGPWSNLSYKVDWATVFHEMAADPQRLKTLPGDLSKAAKDLGIPLPTPGPGTSIPGNILKQIPGAPQAPSPPTSPEGPNETQKQVPTLPFGLPSRLLGK